MSLKFPNVPVGTGVYWREMDLTGSVVARIGNETTIRWSDGAETIVADDDDDPDQFTVIEPEAVSEPIHVQ